ncbi:ankyrin repeat domain-containing protein 29-like [Mytilus edulis]|uniref:ankyrin repeat domain-containing protein 29-like n=1 Tax=Mytilus edulis TaxID=6550 RepID=UPI0039EF09FB
MKHKPDINAQTYDGGNALYFSTWNGNVEMMQLLLENNADYEYKQGLCDSFLEKALPHVADYISKKSIDYVFDVDAGSSPLHIACFMGRLDVVRCLLDYNANINITKEDGTSPLLYACEVGHEDIVCLLLDKGADTQICRLNGASPLTIATDNGHTSIVMMLKITQRKKKVKLNSCSFVSGSL